MGCACQWANASGLRAEVELPCPRVIGVEPKAAEMARRHRAPGDVAPQALVATVYPERTQAAAKCSESAKEQPEDVVVPMEEGWHLPRLRG